MAVLLRKTDEKLRLAYGNSDDARGRKLELEQFLSVHGVGICPLSKTHNESGRALRFWSYVAIKWIV
jgi:hypothetical protein